MGLCLHFLLHRYKGGESSQVSVKKERRWFFLRNTARLEGCIWVMLLGHTSIAMSHRTALPCFLAVEMFSWSGTSFYPIRAGSARPCLIVCGVRSSVHSQALQVYTCVRHCAFDAGLAGLFVKHKFGSLL